MQPEDLLHNTSLLCIFKKKNGCKVKLDIDYRPFGGHQLHFR